MLIGRSSLVLSSWVISVWYRNESAHEVALSSGDMEETDKWEKGGKRRRFQDSVFVSF